ncbi:sensor histidine kinase [Melioribacter sp. Ez-97]|uniref:sensor histidine kinase n=1 Tax=Melioribacter sp. Ez-97 TaxID=3423434 RepID=UPI003EDB677A
MEEELKLDPVEIRYYRLIRYLTDYIYSVKVEDGKAVKTYHGPGCAAVTGYTSEDYQKDPELWYRMVHPDDRPAVLKQAEDALAGKDVEPLEHRIIHRDGSIRWVKNSIVLSKDENGNVIYYDGLINDITELKKAQGLAESKQKQLIQADKMVALGTMVSGIAHEINNPNNFILLNAQFLKKAFDDILPVLKEYTTEHDDYYVAGIPSDKAFKKIVNALDGIIEGSTRIEKITNSLKEFAKKDSGRLDQTVDLNKAVEKAVMITSNLIKKSTGNFKVNYNADMPNIKGNSQQIEQVMINLIANACQALPDKNRGIEIFLYRKDNYAAVEVKDEGTGIDEENIKFIFDPFFTTKRNSGGTGLGLYVSYNIIKNHGGDIIVESDGKGTKFIILLPIN